MLSGGPEVQGTERIWCGHLKRGSYREGRRVFADEAKAGDKS